MFYFNKYKAFLIRRIFDAVALFYRPDKSSLQDMLRYCSENIGFYQGRGSSLDKYGYTGKTVVRDHFDAFVKRGPKIMNAGVTSGTTGTPGKFFRDIRSMAMEQYFQSSYFKWKGKYKIFFRGEKLFDISYKGDKIYKDIPLIKEMYVSSFHINDHTLAHLVERLKCIPHKCLWAYPSSAYMLADYCRKNGIKLDFDVVATSSETLLDYQVETIEKVFGCKLKDWYGQAERVAALVRCEYGHYHELGNYSYMEYLPFAENQYEIVGSTLHNRVMPLIRYNIHDIVEISNEPCPCGHSGRNIVKIHGRTNSYIELPNGKLYETPLAFLFKMAKNVVEAQIVQKKDRSVLIRVVRGEGYAKEDEEELVQVISGFIPKEIFSLEYVERIERDSRGKFRYVINENL